MIRMNNTQNPQALNGTMEGWRPVDWAWRQYGNMHGDTWTISDI